MSLTVEDLAGSYHLAWTDHDPGAIAALHTEDSVFHMHGVCPEAIGRSAVHALVTVLLTLIPDLHFELKRLHLGLDHIVIEYDMSGAVGDSTFHCDGVDVIAVSDGLVARKDTYLDLTALTAQVDTLPTLTAS